MDRKRSKKLDARSDPQARSVPPPVQLAGLAPASGAAADTIHAGAAPRPHAPFVGVRWPPPSAPDVSEWGYPPGGFLIFVQPNAPPPSQPFPNYPIGSTMPENLVGGSMSHSSISPGTPSSQGTPSPIVPSAVENAQMGSQGKGNAITIDNEESPQHARSDKRLNWSNEEDIRLVSAWLHNSVDPAGKNDKKAGKYWADVTATYNSTTERRRERNQNQLKLRWERIKKNVGEFNGCYARITKGHQSGMSDDQKMGAALQLYASEHDDKPFTMAHVWRGLRHEKKWLAYVKKINKDKDKGSAHVVHIDGCPRGRPIDQKRARVEKNGETNGESGGESARESCGERGGVSAGERGGEKGSKRNTPEAVSALGEKLDKFLEATTESEKMAELQHTLADKKIEAASLTHKAAQEATRIKMLELYRELLFAPTSDLSEAALAERTKALECLRSALFDTKN